MSENTCGSCRYWGTDDDAGRVHRQCTRILHDKPGHVDDTYDGFEQDEWYDADDKRVIQSTRMELAVVRDGSGYFAALKTRDDFGCKLHEPADHSEVTAALTCPSNDETCAVA